MPNELLYLLMRLRTSPDLGYYAVSEVRGVRTDKIFVQDSGILEIPTGFRDSMRSFRDLKDPNMHTKIPGDTKISERQ